MGPEFHKIFKLFEELEEAGQTATLTFTSKGGKSTFKLQLESSPSSPSTTSPTPPAASAPAPGGRRRRHRGAAARARRRQRAADHQGTTLAASASVSPSSSLPDPGEASVPAGPQHGLLPQRRPYSPSSSPLHLPPQGDAGSCLWQGCLCHHLAASTSTATLPPHHLDPPHLPLHLLRHL